MPRGGKREGSGGKPSWKHGKTKPIRVPVALADRIIEIARIIDEEGDSQVGTIDLSGVAIHQSKCGPVVRLADLLRVGYSIKPERLARSLEARMRKESEIEVFLRETLDEYEQ